MEIHSIVEYIRLKITKSQLKNRNILLTQLRHRAENYLLKEQVKEESLNELYLFIQMVEIDLTLLENNFMQS